MVESNTVLGPVFKCQAKVVELESGEVRIDCPCGVSCSSLRINPAVSSQRQAEIAYSVEAYLLRHCPPLQEK